MIGNLVIGNWIHLNLIELRLWNPIVMDVRCAFVLMAALVATLCSAKPTEKAEGN